MMPWINGSKTDMSVYRVPDVCTSLGIDDDGNDLILAKQQRAYLASSAQELKATQDALSKAKEYDLARFISGEVKYNLSEQRAWDFVVKCLEGSSEYFTWKPEKASEELAPLIDSAFWYLTTYIHKKGEDNE